MTDELMTLEKFRASRTFSENLTEIAAGEFYDNDGNIIPGRGYVYDEGCYIEMRPDGQLMLILFKDGWTMPVDRLHELELRLYEWATWECYDTGVPDEDEKMELTIGVEFVNRLERELGPELFKELRALNAAEPDPLVCHSHDHLDANEVMLAAAEHVLEELYACESVTEEYPLTELIELCGRAWNHVRPLLGR